uniref:Uncharacterized protein n=1 Tax=Octopus bimaculoides TaxID=37653 RepID=A0A0L8FZP6_OCTBM
MTCGFTVIFLHAWIIVFETRRCKQNELWITSLLSDIYHIGITSRKKKFIQ